MLPYALLSGRPEEARAGFVTEASAEKTPNSARTKEKTEHDTGELDGPQHREVVVFEAPSHPHADAD